MWKRERASGKRQMGIKGMGVWQVSAKRGLGAKKGKEEGKSGTSWQSCRICFCNLELAQAPWLDDSGNAHLKHDCQLLPSSVAWIRQVEEPEWQEEFMLEGFQWSTRYLVYCKNAKWQSIGVASRLKLTLFSNLQFWFHHLTTKEEKRVVNANWW